LVFHDRRASSLRTASSIKPGGGLLNKFRAIEMIPLRAPAGRLHSKETLPSTGYAISFFA
jgi:hypothetical protein